MTISRAWAIGICVVLGLAIVLGGYEWLQEHDARLKAEASTAAEQKTIDQAKTDTATIQKTLAGQLQTLEAQRSQPATPQQIVIDASKFIPNLPQPLQVITPPPTQTIVDGKTEEVPSAPVVQIPTADLAAIQAGAVTCQEDAANLTACTLTAADTAIELKATTAQRDTWEKTAKGGSWLHKTLNAAKWIVVGAGVGYVAGHKW